MTYFCIIFAEKNFFAKNLRFCTSTKIFIKIQTKMSKRQPIKKNFFLPIAPLNLLLMFYQIDKKITHMDETQVSTCDTLCDRSDGNYSWVSAWL